MIKRLAVLLSIFCVSSIVHAQVKILFDATKAETAGNADWVIDADKTNLSYGSNGLPYISTPGNKSNPNRIPTPAQSTITVSTPETYWTGSLSTWAIDLVNKGYVLETLPYDGSITYNDTTNAQDLSNYKVFVVDEPNIRFSASEKIALMHFVQNGGGLFMISDHNGSDRNNDGWDSPAIWNDFFTNNGIQVNPFGISVDLKDFSGTFNYVISSSNDSILHGPMGNVTSVIWHNGTSMTIDPMKNTTVQGVVHNISPASGNNNVVVAYAHYGNGKVGMMTDSSPFDDGTGNPNASLYSSYAVDGSNREAIMNMTIWLATPNPVGVPVVNTLKEVTVYPNPSSGYINIQSSVDLEHTTVKVYDVTGKMVSSYNPFNLLKSTPFTIKLNSGFYLIRISALNGEQTIKTIVY